MQRKSFIFIAGYSIYGIATPPSIYPFPYPCCKGIKIDIRITKHQNQVRTGWDKSEREKKKQRSQEGHTGGLMTLITHNLRGRDTVSPQASSERKKERGVLLPPHPTGTHSYPMCCVNLQLFWSYASMFLSSF